MHGLLDHLKLLTVMGNLILGAGIGVYLYQARHRCRLAPLGPVLVHAVFYNLLVLSLFVRKYYDLNVAPAGLPLSPALTQNLTLLLAYAFIMGFSYASLAIYLAFMERRIPVGLLRLVGLGSVLLLLGIPAGLFLPWGSAAQLAHYGFYDNFGLVFILLELGLMIALPLGARRFQDAERRRIAYAFSFLYLSRYPVVAALALLPQPFRLVFALAYPNVVPYVWLRFLVLPHAERTAAREAMKSDMEWVGQRYGLSPRERQILGLLLAGKSNRDMEESLFISYHTVKNHVYNIYRKLGVKTRFELLHLVARSHAGERAGDP